MRIVSYKWLIFGIDLETPKIVSIVVLMALQTQYLKSLTRSTLIIKDLWHKRTLIRPH